MDRRNFIQRITAAGAATGIAGAAEAKPDKTVSYMVRGFTCITCAVGLETMLKREKGVASVKATYPEGRVVVGYDSKQTNSGTIRKFINETTGFTVAEEKL